MAAITEEMVECAERLARLAREAGLERSYLTMLAGDGEPPVMLSAEDARGNSYSYCGRSGHDGS